MGWDGRPGDPLPRGLLSHPKVVSGIMGPVKAESLTEEPLAPLGPGGPCREQRSECQETEGPNRSYFAQPVPNSLSVLSAGWQEEGWLWLLLTHPPPRETEGV